MNLPSVDRLGNGVTAKYDFSIFAVLNEGWSKVNGLKLTLWGGILLCILTYIILGLIIAFTLSTLQTTLTVASLKQLLYILTVIRNLVIGLMFVGILLLTIKRAVKLPTHGIFAFSYFKHIGKIISITFLGITLSVVPLLLAGFLISIIADYSSNLPALSRYGSMLIFFLGVFSAIYLLFSYSFAIPLMIEEKLGIWRALETSRKAVMQHWFKIFFTTVLQASILFIAGLPFFIGLLYVVPLHTVDPEQLKEVILSGFIATPQVFLIFNIFCILSYIALLWTIPFIYNVQDILYKIIFGIQETTPQ